MKIDNITDEDFKNIILSCKNYSQICRKIGCYAGTYHITAIEARMKNLNLNADHFEYKFHSPRVRKRDISFYLVKGSINLTCRERLFKEGLLEKKCSSCGLGTTWNNKPITLQVDHINGDRTDNRLENLRVLCPNCHTQTETYGAKRRKKPKKPTRTELGINKSYGPRPHLRRVIRPTKEELQKLILEKPIREIAKQIGIGETSVRKWCNLYDIKRPSYGYWLRRYSGKTHEEASKAKEPKIRKIRPTLSEEQRNKILELRKTGMKKRKIAKELNVGRMMVIDFLNGKTFKDHPRE